MVLIHVEYGSVLLNSIAGRAISMMLQVAFDLSELFFHKFPLVLFILGVVKVVWRKSLVGRHGKAPRELIIVN
jgi:hypothetical protein